MDRKKVYQRARALLKRDGWTTGIWIAAAGGSEEGDAYQYGKRGGSPNEKCPMCIEGAVYRAAGELGIPYSDVRDELIRPLDVLAEEVTGIRGAMDLNDASEEPDEVFRLLDVAIDRGDQVG